MKMKKKIFLFLLCGTFLFAVTGCGNDSNTNDNPTSKQKNSKINLNDNIEVTINTKSTGTPDCFFYMFTTNLQEVFPNAKIDNYNNYRSVSYWMGNASDSVTGEITEEGLTNNINSLQFNSNQEIAIIDLFKQYQDDVYEGIKEVNYTFENHRLTFSYDYLVFKNNDYKSDGENLDSKVQQILLDATRFEGTCGGFDFSEETTLTEDLCDEYHLSCDRW